MGYSVRQEKYIASVDGAAHFSALQIIGELEFVAASVPALLDCLEEAASQYRCGCGHPACNVCERVDRWDEVIRRAKGTNDER